MKQAARKLTRLRISDQLEQQFKQQHPRKHRRHDTLLKRKLETHKNRITVAMAMGLLLAMLMGTAKAASLDDVMAGSLLMESQSSNEMTSSTALSTRVEMRVTGMMAEVDVEQEFRNDSGDWVEAIYAFPLPETAAVNRMLMQIGSRRIEGEIQEKQQAVRTYQAARAAGKKASLVTQQRPNLFTSRVANLGPGEAIMVSITYVQQLDYRDGQFSLRFPTTLRPRYHGAADGHEGLFAEEMEPDMSQQVAAADDLINNPMSLRIHLNPGFELVQLESRYHDIDIADSNGLYMIELAEGAVPADRDFELIWEPRLSATPQAAIFAESGGDQGYALLMVMPPQPKQAQKQPRELILVVDTSGSMQGDSIEQARESLLMALGTLVPEDRFNIIQFNSAAEALFDQPLRADDAALVKAADYINALEANGGTNMAPALGLALSRDSRSQHVRQVVFITDGAIGNEVELFGLIEAGLGDTRLFTVGIGAAPNGYFMRKAAQFGRGTFTFIGKVDEVAEKMDRLLSRLENPVLTDVCVHWPGYAETYPRETPDLYLGEPLIVVAQLDRLQGDTEVCGETGNSSWNQFLNLKSNQEHSGIATLWGRRKIGSLMDDLALGGNAEQIRNQVLDVALAQRLLSRYTSFVAVDKTPERSLESALQKARVANLKPAGGPESPSAAPNPAMAMALAVPQTASDAPLRLIWGLMLLSISWVFSRRLRDAS
jgi:Ca-activated chloride channel family protein